MAKFAKNYLLRIFTLIIGIFLFSVHIYADDAIPKSETFTLCEGFYYEELPEDFKIVAEGNLNDEDNKYIRPKDLRKAYVKYIGYDGEAHDGSLIVAYEAVDPETKEIINVAKEVLEIFEELYEKKFPIDCMSCFNFRNISGKSALSWHAYGLAIDLNYNQNPYCAFDEEGDIKKTIPAHLEKYGDRSLDEKGMIKPGDDCYKAFISRNWEWGGDWNSIKDYMHFQRFSWKSPRPEAKY